MSRLRAGKQMLLFVSSVALLAVGGAAWLLGRETLATVLWFGDTVLGLVVSLLWMAAAVRRRQPSVDMIAVLALAGALAVDEPFAGAVITVMLAAGSSWRPARRGGRGGSSACWCSGPRVRPGAASRTVSWRLRSTMSRGDRVLVGAGEIVPADGRLLCSAVLDESALTGEPLPSSGGPATTSAAVWSTRVSRSTWS